VKPPGKVPLVAGIICLGLWMILAFQASTAYDLVPYVRSPQETGLQRGADQD